MAQLTFEINGKDTHFIGKGWHDPHRPRRNSNSDIYAGGNRRECKGSERDQLVEDVQAKIILGNTYHLYLRPGTKDWKTPEGCIVL